MTRTKSTWIFALLLFVPLMLTGCGGKADKKDDAGGTESGDTETSAGDDIEINLAKLSAEDRALAETQATCPVGGGKLGAMGVPVKVEVEGKSVFVCCESCKEPLMAEPEKYLADLKGGSDSPDN